VCVCGVCVCVCVYVWPPIIQDIPHDSEISPGYTSQT